jgi:hypothetical protein
MSPDRGHRGAALAKFADHSGSEAQQINNSSSACAIVTPTSFVHQPPWAFSNGLGSPRPKFRRSLRTASGTQLPAMPPRTQRRIQQENLPYTIKSGDFRLLITPSLELDYIDNVNVSDQNPQQDFILRPFLDLRATYPISRRNLLPWTLASATITTLTTPAIAGPRLQSGSQIAFRYLRRGLQVRHSR